MNLQPTPPPPPPVRRQKTKTRRLSHKKKRASSPVGKKRNRPKTKPVFQGKRRPIRRELSAGGVAIRQERGTWFVALLKTEHKRGEVWVLPKGHVELEKNERISEAARREVQEELGINNLSVKDQLGVTRFTFQAEDALVRKTVHYFLMITQEKKLTPQAEEYFLDAGWFPVDVAIEMLEYDTDQEIVARAKQRLVPNFQPRKPERQQSRSSQSAPRVHL